MRPYTSTARFLRWAIGLSASAALPIALPTALSAQRTVCLNGAPRPACSGFLILEAGGLLPIVQTTRGVSWSGQPPVEQTAFGDRLHWEVGMMRNVSGTWALGAAANLGSGPNGALSALTVRGRRWLGPDLGLDLSAGAGFRDNGAGPRRVSPVADARLNVRDDLFLGVRWEQAVLPRVREVDSRGTVFFDDPGGRQHALSLLVGTGSEWAIGSTAALGLALIALIASVDWQ